MQRPLEGGFRVKNKNKNKNPQIISRAHVRRLRSVGQLATSNKLQNEYGTIMWNAGYSAQGEEEEEEEKEARKLEGRQGASL